MHQPVSTVPFYTCDAVPKVVSTTRETVLVVGQNGRKKQIAT